VPNTNTILELRPSSDVGIFAVPYRGGRPSPAVRLPDGSIVERPTPDQRRNAPDRVGACFDVATDGGPASIHHINLGLIKTFLLFQGFYLLSSGDVAAVYGAEANPIG
jgi:hypothetical protein